MKAKCLKSDNIEYLTVGKEYEVVEYDKYDNMISFYNDKNELYSYYIYYNYELWFEIIDENKCDKELTFREVIAKIKEGEVWENGSKRIEIVNGQIQIARCNGNVFNDFFLIFSDKTPYKLKRKQYTFEEAFKSYEEGKEIESCETGARFKKIDNKDMLYMPAINRFSSLGRGFNIDEVRGKWHINNK